jgi:hypothetical protein
MRAFLRRFLMHYGIYRRYPLGLLPRHGLRSRRQGRQSEESAASAPTLDTKSTPAPGQPRRGDGGRPFEGQSPGSRPQPGRTRRVTASLRSARPGSSATRACRGWWRVARSSARRRPLLRRARPRRQPAVWHWWRCPGPASERPSPQYPAESNPQSSQNTKGLARHRGETGAPAARRHTVRLYRSGHAGHMASTSTFDGSDRIAIVDDTADSKVGNLGMSREQCIHSIRRTLPTR